MSRLDARALRDLVLDAGSYQILVGDSSRNLPLTGTITLASAITDNAMD